MVQGLEVSCAKALNHDNYVSLCKNLQQLYKKYNYAPNRIWNCNEFGVQAGHNGGGRVLAKKRFTLCVWVDSKGT
jgi:hypothetical protein